MKNILILILSIFLFSSCRDESKSPYPNIAYGATFIVRLNPEPSPVTAANIATLSVKLANAATGNVAFSTQSLNATDIEKVDVYVRHARGTVSTPLLNAAAPHGTLLKSMTNLASQEQFALTELASKSGFVLANLAANDRFVLKFVATMKDGRIFSADNSGPGITANALGTTFTPFLNVVIVP